MTLRVRAYGTSGSWAQASTTVARPGGPVAPRTAPRLPGAALWAADLTPLLNATAAFAAAAPGLSVARELAAAPDGVGIVMSLVLTNSGREAVEVGGLDISLVTDNDWTGLSLEQNAARCSLSDPYPGLDGGFVRVVRIAGGGPVLIVAPASSFACSAALPGLTDCGGRLENWRQLREDPARRGVSFEGFYAWVVHSKAWAEQEWAAAQQFNEPSTLVLRAGESAVYSLRLATSSFSAIDAALVAMQVPLARSIPGTVLTSEMATARLLVRPPPGFSLNGSSVDPPFVLSVSAAQATPGGSGFLALPLAAASGATGRARVTLRFSAPGAPRDLLHTVHYMLVPPLPSHAQRLGAFASGLAWLNDTSDAFGRAFSFGHFDAALDALTLQESRAWVAGLSDESGAAMALAAVSLAAARPDDDGAALAVAQLATYVNRTLLGSKADGAGRSTSIAQADGGIRASMFFSGMPNFSYSVTPCWDEPRSLTTWRAYNYVHQMAVQLLLYRLARDAPCTIARASAVAAAAAAGLDAPQAWQVYLRGAAATLAAMWALSGPGAFLFLSQYGLMVGSAHVDLLDALAEEAAAAGPGGGEWAALFAASDSIQRQRTYIWGNLTFPFGSEMPWDSTGQEEIFSHAQRYGAYMTANLTLLAVKAYTNDVPHWGLSGSARRYFDFLVYGSPRQNGGDTEREYHHYGSVSACVHGRGPHPHACKHARTPRSLARAHASSAPVRNLNPAVLDLTCSATGLVLRGAARRVPALPERYLCASCGLCRELGRLHGD